MRTLYVLRHGIAHPHATPEFEEDERPLTLKGRRRMREIARGLRRLKVRPDRILTSPLPRARETAEIVAKRLGLADRVELAEALRVDRPAESIRAWLDDQEGDEVMIVGHNPTFSALISVLPIGPGAPTVTELKKGGLACFSVGGPGAYRLEWLAPPRLIRRLA
ncbi:phosphohistidine phosphatase SixA [Tautonia plasticadhaerens]|uniref:Phosphohistidine phosphatase SixA n=1 Tax=Tautonia plasticadhaerens TaxID=2527974 RepID=A0A518H721_9BACT|nr:phosphohistidine phosphatase SixA [Tautonia plasticadhaerens]QDV36679.1 Phosphohistidine phosphatase SixA [Tautonia plasticadhaerens]